MQVNEVVVNGVTELSLVNDTVSEETLLDGTTAHDASGKQITGKVVPYNPNLLINPDFSINQRGQAEYVDVGYSVDGWRISSDTVYNAASKTISAKSSGALEYYLEQVVEDVASLRGREITFSADVSSAGTCLAKIYTFNGLEYTVAASDAVAEGIAICALKVPEDATSLFVRVLGLGSYTTTVKRAKLEIGVISTLISDVPNPAVEMAKCQRYFRTISRGAHVEYAGVNGTDVVIRVPFEVPMRVAPTCFVLNHKAGLNFCNGWVEESTELTILNVSATPYGITFLHVSGFNLSGLNLQIGQSLTLDTDNVFGISAEL